MKIYFAGYKTAPDVVNQVRGDFGVLISYIECGAQQIEKLNKPLFLDSGAFSVMTKGIEIDIDDYAFFIKNNIENIELYANLDIIGDAVATTKNQEHLESLGLNPLPTFHYGSSYSELTKLIQKYDYIGLGGLVPIARYRDKLKKHLDTCFAIISRIKPTLKTHGWGMTSHFAVTRYPFYSVDSTSWLVGGKFRTKMEYSNKGMKPIKSPTHSAYSHYNLNMLNAAETIKMIEDATRLWKHRGVTFD